MEFFWKMADAALRRVIRPRSPSPEEQAREAQRRYDTQKQAEEFFESDRTHEAPPIDFSRVEHWRNDVTEDE